MAADPDQACGPDPDQLTHQGVLLQQQGLWQQAIICHRQALQRQPNHAQALNNLGIALAQLGDLDGAGRSFRLSIAANPDGAEAHNNLGHVLDLKGDRPAAWAAYRQALKLWPHYPEALNNLGSSLQAEGDLEGAIEAYTQALEARPDYISAHNNLGLARQELGDLPGALQSLERALALQPGDADLNKNLAMAELLAGHYAKGWVRYEHRLHCADDRGILVATPPCPRWDGGPLAGDGPLLLVAEQGLGDTLQFMRYGLVFRQRGYGVRLCAPTKLHGLIQSSGIDPAPLAPHEASMVRDGCWLPLLSAPRHLGVNPANPILVDPYIQIPESRVLSWRERLATEQPRSLIGIHWQGSPGHEATTSRGRSLPLELFAPIAARDDIKLISLQKGHGSEQRLSCSFRHRFVNCQPAIDACWDFVDTAAIIRNCDLVITNDSAVAHLAAGLGVATWLLLKRVPEWRWGLEGETSFWYPSMRLFRQQQRGDWSEVMQRVAQALATELDQNTDFRSQPWPLAGSRHPDHPAQPSAPQPANHSARHRPLRADISPPPELLRAMVDPSQERLRSETNPSETGLNSERGYTDPDSSAAMRKSRSRSAGFSANKRPSPEGAIRLEKNQPDSTQSQRLEQSGEQLIQQRRFQDAERLFRQLIATGSASASAYSNLAALCGVLGKQQEIPALLRHALALQPDYPEAHHNLAVALQQQGDLDGAIAAYSRALDLRPEDSGTRFRLGTALMEQGQLERAIDCFRQVVAVRPDDVSAHTHLGLALLEQGDLSAAVESLEAAHALQPDHPTPLYNLANAKHQQGDFDAAIALFHRVLAGVPQDHRAWNNLGLAQIGRADFEGAIHSFQNAVELDHTDPEPLNNLGIAYKDKGDLPTACDCLRRAVELYPSHADAWMNLGIVWHDLGEPQRALPCFDRALELRPDHMDTHLTRAASRMISGDYAGGWQDYGWRFGTDTNPAALQVEPYAIPEIPPWDGTPLLPGDRLLLVSEQGLGDTVQFMRYAIPLQQQGVKVSLCAPPKLHGLIVSSGIDPAPLSSDTVQAVRDGRWIPMLSLPQHLGVSADRPLIRDPYIKTEPQLIEKWRDILAAEQRPIIGLHWQGNPAHERFSSKGRSFPLEALQPISEIPGIRLLSLQKGAGSEQLPSCRFRDRFVDCQPRVDATWDFLETAAIIANCDLVISSDSVLPHLAAGLGTPTWLLLKTVPEWRWGLHGDRSFWYSAMRLFRQSKPDDWSELVERVASELTHWLAEASPQATPAAAAAGAASAPIPAPAIDDSLSRWPGLVQVPISFGELIDKITILRIKQQRMQGSAREHVQRELAALETSLANLPLLVADDLVEQLQQTNRQLWDIEDAIRARELAQDFGEEFIRLARSVYQQNDCRAAIKREINLRYGSALVEQKSYQSY